MFKRNLERLRAERNGKKPQKRKKKERPRPKPKPKKVTPKEKQDEIKTKVEKEEIKEEEQEKETEPPLIVEIEKEDEILEKKIEIEEIKVENDLIKNEVFKMTEQQEEIPLMKFEGDAAAPILRYDLPSPSSYEGKNYIEINDIEDEPNDIKFNEEAVYQTKSYREIMIKNREEIKLYLSNISRAELEEDMYGLEVEEVQVPEEDPSTSLNEQITQLETEIQNLEKEKQDIIDAAQRILATGNIIAYGVAWVAGATRCIIIDNILIAKNEHLDGLKNMLANLDTSITMTYPVKPTIPENVDTFQARYKLFKYYLKIAMSYKQLVPAFYKTLGNHLKIKFIKVEELKPRMLFIETFRLTNFPGDYGAGTTVKTFSLLPRESTEISIKTWKKTEEVTKKASSILDSYTEEKADEFEKAAQAECARSSKIDKTSSYSVKASANAGWGWGSASVSAGTEGSSSSSREASAKNVMSAISKHAQSASAQREVNIDTEHEKRVEIGLETSIMRKIRNLNVTRTLNFTFRQMNQQYHSILHLVDLRIGFYNGYPGSLREYPLSDLVYFVEKYMKNPATFLPELKKIILDEYTNVYDYHRIPQALIEEVNDESGTRPYLRVKASIDKEGNPYGQQKYLMRPEKKDKDGKIVQQADERWLDGVILKNQTITMKTAGVIVESLMGKVNALDDYAYLYRTEKIRRKKVENDRIADGLLLVKQLMQANKHNEAVLAYKQTFGVEPGIDVLKDLFTFKLESPRD